MPTSPIEDDPTFQKFIQDLEAMRGQMPLHRPNDRLVYRILRQLPPVRKTIPGPGWRIFRWTAPFAVGGALASIGFLFFSPYAPFDIVRKTPVRSLSGDVAEARSQHLAQSEARVSINPIKEERTAAVRLTRLMHDYQTASRWLADAGVTSPASKAYGLKVLTELAATGFTENDWQLFREALPAPRSITELLQGAQCAHLWQRAGAGPEAWQPILTKAADLKRIPDVLQVTQTVRAERIQPDIMMTALESGLARDKNAQNILTEMRTAALPHNALPQDAPQVRADSPLPAADLPRAE